MNRGLAKTVGPQLASVFGSVVFDDDAAFSGECRIARARDVSPDDGAGPPSVAIRDTNAGASRVDVLDTVVLRKEELALSCCVEKKGDLRGRDTADAVSGSALKDGLILIVWRCAIRKTTKSGFEIVAGDKVCGLCVRLWWSLTSMRCGWRCGS